MMIKPSFKHFLVFCLLLTVGCAEIPLNRQIGNNSWIHKKDPYELIAISRQNFNLFFSKEPPSLRPLNQAIETAWAAMELDPTVAEAYYLQGAASAVKGLIIGNWVLTQRGLDRYDQFLAMQPDLAAHPAFPPVPHLVAVILSHKDKISIKDRQKIVSLLKQAVRITPNNADAHTQLSMAYEKLGNTGIALEEAKIAAELAPDDATAQKWLSMLYTQHVISSKDTKRSKSAAIKAIKAMKRAIRIDPDDQDSLVKLATLYGMVGQYELKANTLETAAALKNTGPLQLELAFLCMARGQIDKAETHYKQALKLNKADPEYLKHYAYCLYIKGEYPSAIKQVSKYIKTSESFSTYAALLKYNAMRAIGKQSQGKNYIKRVYTDFSGDPWEKSLLAYHAGLLNEQALINKAKWPGEQCEANYYVGTQYWHSGEKEKAAKYFKKSAETNMHDYVEFYGAKIRLAQQL